MMLFLKNDLGLPWPQKYEKIFPHEDSKNVSECIWRQLKHHQYRTRCKTGILLEIILSVFK